MMVRPHDQICSLLTPYTTSIILEAQGVLIRRYCGRCLHQNFFLWLATKNKLHTGEILAKKGWNVNLGCIYVVGPLEGVECKIIFVQKKIHLFCSVGCSSVLSWLEDSFAPPKIFKTIFAYLVG